MKAERLAQVLHEMTSNTKGVASSTALDSFMSYIKARGYETMLPRILTEYEQLSASKDESEVIVTTAKKQSAKEILSAHNIEGNAHSRVDETIVGGYQIETGSRFIDASHKSALVRLYQTLTR